MADRHLQSHRLPILSSYVSMISLAAAVNSAPVCLTAMASTFGLAEGQMGMVAGAIFMGIVVGICVSGPLCDRFGMKPFLLIGAGSQGAGMLCVALAPSHATLLAALFVAGFGGGVLDALLSPLVCALRPDEKPQAMNLLHAFYCIGAALTVCVAMLLLRLHCHWRTVFAVGAAPSIAAIVGFTFSLLPRGVGAGEAAERLPVGLLCRSGTFALMALAMLLCGGTELGPAQWLPAYVERALRWERGNAALALLLFSLAMAAGRLAGSRIAKHASPSGMVIASALASAALILLMSQPYSPTLSLVSGTLLGVAVAPLWPTTLALAASRFPNGGATMFSMLAAAGNAGGFFVPLAVGLVAEQWDMHWGLASIVVLPLLLVAIIATTARRAP